MKIARASVPVQLKTFIEKQPPTTSGLPGLLADTSGLIKQYPQLRSGAANSFPTGLAGIAPCLVVEPEQAASIFTPDQLDLLKTVTRSVAGQISPHLKTSVDAVWLVYSAKSLYASWNQPDRDTMACLFKAAGLTMGMAGVIGNAYPDMKIPEHWSNGINYLVKSGGAIYEGKTPPLNEMLWSSAKLPEIYPKLLKVAGVALDGDASYQAISAQPLPPVSPKK